MYHIIAFIDFKNREVRIGNRRFGINSRDVFFLLINLSITDMAFFISIRLNTNIDNDNLCIRVHVNGLVKC